jgi:hypothetical protein
MAGPSQAVIANGCKFLRGDGGTPEVFTEVAETFDVGTGAASAPDIDVSHLGSVAREKRGGLPDFGSATVQMNYVQGNAQQEAMEAEAGKNVVRNYKTLLPDGIHGWVTVLILKSMSTTGFVVDGKLVRTATFAVSGAPVPF